MLMSSAWLSYQKNMLLLIIIKYAKLSEIWQNPIEKLKWVLVALKIKKIL